MPELSLQRRERARGDDGKSLVNGEVPGAGHLAQRRCAWRANGARVGLGAVLEVAQRVDRPNWFPATCSHLALR